MVSLKTVLSTLAVASIQLASAIAVPEGGVTPHDQYSSSVGVLGCKIDTNRVAYWPTSVDCNDICVEVTANGRSVNLLKIDQSGGAYDISFDAWHYLAWGEPALEGKAKPGGKLAAEYRFVPADNCRHLIHTASGKLPFTAANSMNFVSHCNATKTWVGQNFEMWNIQNSVCTWGIDELCTYPNVTAGFNQPECPSKKLGANDKLEGHEVWNILYPSGKLSQALA